MSLSFNYFVLNQLCFIAFLNPRVSPNGTVSVIEGSNLTLTCSDPGNSGTPRYVWINDSDGSELTPVINDPPLTLYLTNINREASGNYTCRSTNTDLPGVNKDTAVTLNVQCKPLNSITFIILICGSFTCYIYNSNSLGALFVNSLIINRIHMIKVKDFIIKDSESNRAYM